MCTICANVSSSLQPNGFFDRFGLTAQNETDSPLFFLNADERGLGPQSPSNKISLSVTGAGFQISRESTRWSTNIGEAVVVTYAYRSTAPTTMPTDTSGFSRFNSTQINITEQSLQSWADVANITFQRVNDGDGYSNNASILFGNYSSGADGAAAFAYRPTPGATGANQVQGDVWTNSSLNYNAAPSLANYGFQVLTHEIGHAIGLLHPGAYNASAGQTLTYAANAEYYEDSRQYSVMSYFSEANTGGAFAGRYSAAPLMDDIAAAQRLYGANMTTRTGNDTYGFNSNTNRSWLSATSSGDILIFAVWDAGGVDTFDFSGYGNNQVIDLRQGNFSNVGSLIGNVSIAVGVTIENAIGGSGSDTITGNSADNILRGNGGDDTIDGGFGTDTAVFSGNRSAYTITFQGGLVRVDGPEGIDFYANVERLQFADQVVVLDVTTGVNVTGDLTDDQASGTVFADTMSGGSGNDTLNGLGGDDTLNGDRGNDTLNGGDGADALNGGEGNDTLNGDAGNDTLNGGAGNDTLNGGAGDDTLNGGVGINVLNGGDGNDSLTVGDGVTQGAAVVVKAQQTTNSTRGTAVNLDQSFDLENEAGVSNATTIPHAVIQATGHGGWEYYAFTVTAGAQGTFDIDNASFDSYIYLIDANGNILAANDDRGTGTGETEGAGTDSLLTYTFPTAGTYYIMVNQWNSSTTNSQPGPGVPTGATYTLNVSITGHAVVPITTLGSTLDGGIGDDILTGGSGNDALIGGAGTDTAVYSGNRSAYTISTAGGVTTITGPQGTDTLTGIERVQFADQLVTLSTGVSLSGDSGPNTLDGGDGADTLAGLGGDDILNGLGGADTLDGGAGDDRLAGGAGADTLIGGSGTDTAVYTDSDAGVNVDLQSGFSSGGHAEGDIYTLVTPTPADPPRADIENLVGSAFTDFLYGTSAANRLEGGGGGDALFGRGGNDILDGGEGADYMDGGAGDDIYYVDNFGDNPIEAVDGGNDTVYASTSYALTANVETLIMTGSNGFVGVGNNLNNALIGNALANDLNGGAGNDTIEGFDGNDYLYGAAGDDLVYGGEGDDWLFGDLGLEVLTGGNDQLYGGAGVDIFIGGPGDDLMTGGTGSDGYVVDSAGDTIVELAGEGTEVVYSFASSFTLAANVEHIFLFEGGITATGNNLDNVMAGGIENNVLYGLTGADSLTGGEGSDYLDGGEGNDFVHGENGDDTIVGGAGSDLLYGGAGTDTFLYASAAHSLGANMDAILDFQVGVDKVDLTSIRTGSSDTFSLFANGDGTYIVVDLGGNGSEDMRILLFQTYGVTTGDILWAQNGAPDAALTALSEAPIADDEGTIKTADTVESDVNPGLIDEVLTGFDAWAADGQSDILPDVLPSVADKADQTGLVVVADVNPGLVDDGLGKVAATDSLADILPDVLPGVLPADQIEAAAQFASVLQEKRAALGGEAFV